MKIFAVLLFLAAASFAKVGLEPAFVRPSSDSLAYFRVDSIVVENGDAFDDSRAYSWADSLVYHVGNWIHLETRESVVRKIILFDVGDSVNLYELIESEKNLRNQAYIADAHITREVSASGKNVLRVKTSDTWTLSIPLSLERPSGDAFYYGIGIWENNFLGFGQTIGIYYSHDEFRDRFMALYNNSNFLFRHNSFEVSLSDNTDGYTNYITMYKPYLSRSRNEWSYTAAGYMNRADVKYYWTGKLPTGEAAVTVPDSVRPKLSTYGRKRGNEIFRVNRLEEDSASFRVGHSFGSEELKFYLGLSYDYHRTGRSHGSVSRTAYRRGENVFAADINDLDEWIPEQLDSRFGVNLTVSRIRYDRLVNFRHAKWTEDVDKGYSVKVGFSKNWKALGALDDNMRIDYRIYLALGSRMHHLTLQAQSRFYFDENSRRDIYELVSAEYIWRSNEWFATQVSGYMDTYKNSAYGKQLSLGGLQNQEFYGFPTYLYTGQARFFGKIEERFFPHFELGTVAPVFAVFMKCGETSGQMHEFEPRDLTYVAGFGVRLAMTKSVSGLVNHLDFSWPLNGPLTSPYPRIALIGLFSL